VVGGGHTFGAIKTAEDVRALFEREYADAVPLMPTLIEDFRRNPVSSLVTVRCWPWSYVSQSGKATAILGDAAHAIVPFYGQGMNCAFEDVRVLAELLGPVAARPDLRSVLDEFQRLRKPNADAIAEMALANFVEMRDKTARPEFLYKKKVEQAVHEMFPDRVTPQYNLVSFSTVPYAEARRRGAAFDAALERIVTKVPMAATDAQTTEEWRYAVRKAAENAMSV
jgi:kynurenine 3-monooxygenase